MTDHKKTEQEQIESILLDLFMYSSSLKFISRLLIDADRRYDSVPIGNIIDHYAGLMSDELNELQAVLN